MLKLVIIILAIAFVVCTAVPAKTKAPAPTPPPQGELIPQATPLLNTPIQTPNSPVNCGETPNNVLACLGNLEVVKKSIASKCKQNLSECDKIKCIFRQSGWSIASFTKDDTVNKQKVAEYFTQYAVDNPLWSAAVQHLKVTCLDKDLPAQGTTHNCAAYDVLHCITTSFLKNAAPTQWSDSTKCAYTRAYASSCPICPTSCFAAQIPYGSCNACLLLPRVP